MRRDFIKLLLVCLTVSLMPCRYLFATGITAGIGSFNQSFPGPYLLYLVTDSIDLAGSEYLEFKWRRPYFTYTNYYEFRLYHGYQTIAGNLILKERINIDNYPFKLPAQSVKEGEVYTWVLLQVLNDGRKSDKSFSSFRIIKK
ncbi:MAG: hypothetical protein BWY16_01070 [Candidatus Omnitrophica bacterium ADurb.Bin205]|nr:MAG: hypothetical protein BWY16_01070 [Candidatus Omnitrophica bacterium ADurb.Bin205]